MEDNKINQQINNQNESEHSHSHHHHSSHHSSSHSSHSSRHHHHSSSKRKKDKNKKKFQLSKNSLIIWISILTIIVSVLAIINVNVMHQLTINNNQIENLSQKLNALTPAPTVAEQQTEKDNTPDFVKTEADRVAKTVKSLQSDNTVSFVAISDMHLNSSDTKAVNALEHAGAAISLIRQQVNVDFATNLGDVTFGSDSTSVQQGSNEMKMAADILKEGFKNIPNFWAVGNHDLLLYSYEKNKDYLDSNELFELIGANNEGAVFQEGEKDRGYCYRDFENKKLRVICLNTNDIKNVTDENVLTQEGQYCTMSSAQIKWLASTLDLSSKSDASQWNILLLSHIPLYTTGYEYVVNLLDGYVSGTAGQVNVRGDIVNFDFTNKNAAKIIGNVHGHLHNFRTDVIGKSRIPTLGIPNACYGRNNSKALSDSEEFRNKYAETTTYDKTYNTAKDTAFCVVTIDLKYKRIYSTCYGAGVDREISF